jgi:hypothetical protein
VDVTLISKWLKYMDVSERQHILESFGDDSVASLPGAHLQKEIEDLANAKVQLAEQKICRLELELKDKAKLLTEG